MIRKSRFIKRELTDVKTHYELVSEIGSGCFGKVFRVREKFSGEIRACKVINKNRIKRIDRFKTEIELLKSIDNHNIVKLLEVYESDIFVYLILEECTGGELFTMLSERSKIGNLISEKEAAFYFKQIICSLLYLHTNGISHRDLKPENLLFCDNSYNQIKVIDFGLSKIFTMDSTMNSVVGTLYYMAPEMIKGEYTELCDIWSAGVILYFMLCGRPPFLSSDANILQEKIFNFKFDSNPCESHLSNEAKDLLRKILTTEDKRINSKEILEHEWINNLSPHSNETINKFDLNYFYEYSLMNKIKKTIISFISYRFNFVQTQELTNIFKSLDKNHDGSITIDELNEGIALLKKNNILNYNDNDIEEIFDEIDLNKNGTIEFNEFISSTIKLEKELKIQHIIEAFRTFDTNKNGKICLKEITEVIKPQTDIDVDYLKELLKKFDTDGDGELDIKEFVTLLGISFS